MPQRIARSCRFPGCCELTRSETGYCEDHKDKAIRDYTKNRPDNGHIVYNNSRWVRVREAYRKRNPLCCECMKEGRITPMKIVDHIIPVKDGGAMFDFNNLQSLCQEHHNRKTGKEKKEKNNAN